MEGALPGMSSLLSGLGPGEVRSVLDLGPASGPSLRVYSGFARWVRFANLPGRMGSGEGRDRMLGPLPSSPGPPYDLILAWNALDDLVPELQSQVVQRIVEVSAPSARLHALFDASGRRTASPMRFSLLDPGRMLLEPVGPPRPRGPQLLPGGVESILEPFHVLRGFSLKTGFREYLAVRRSK